MRLSWNLDAVVRRVRGKANYSNVMSSFAVLLALTGGAYANHLLVLSTDIVDGEVKTVDLASSAVTAAKLASGAVTSGKLANNAVTSSKLANGSVTNAKLAGAVITGPVVVDDSLTGADIVESSLVDVNASALGGVERDELIRLASASSSAVQTLPTCATPLSYLVKSFTAPRAGYVVITGSFTAGRSGTWPSAQGVAARIERTAPAGEVGDWQEDHVPTTSGRTNVAVTQLFSVAEGANTYVLRVCANETVQAIRGQLSFVYSANGTIY